MFKYYIIMIIKKETKFKNLLFENIESKSLLKNKLSECSVGNIMVKGYEEKYFSMIKYYHNSSSNECFGIGILSQCKIDYKNIIMLAKERLIIIFYDNVIDIYMMLDNTLNIIISYQTLAAINDVMITSNKIIIIYEIGVLIVNLKPINIINEIFTDLIIDYEVNDKYLIIRDESDKEYQILL